jgi:DNA gyrase subunit A
METEELPAIEDGLRPLERALLVAMREAAPSYRKTIRFLSSAIGEYPRYIDEILLAAGRDWRYASDPLVAAYAATIDMLVGFRARVPLVEGHGAFGTVHGDSPPADAVSTECRLSPWGAATLDELAPNLLVNGARGPTPRSFHFVPHAPGEVIEALVAMLERRDAPWPAPDFPTGGIVRASDAVRIAREGRGTLEVRARVSVEERGGVRFVVCSEPPPEVDVSTLLEDAGRATRDGRVRDVRSVRDYTDRDGVRIVFECAPDAAPEGIIDALFARTCMSTTLAIDGMARVDGDARCVPLGEVLERTARRLAQRPGSVEQLRALTSAHADGRRTTLV